MKAYLALISTAAIALSACSQEPAKPAADTAPVAASATASAPAAEASAPAASEAAPAAAVDEACSTVVSSDDAMKFDTADINISKACKTFTITLKHVGKMPKAAMGHNIVITKTEDVDAVDKEGAAAGVDNDFVKADDPRIVAHTKLIGGGEETTVTIDTSKFAAGNKYEFFCSFPGHIAMMRGNVNLVD